MNGAEFKTWRESRGMTQADLGKILGMHGDSIARHERSEGAIPKPIEIACAAISLGVKSYSGREIVLNQFKLERFETKSKVQMEQLVSPRWGRSKAAERDDIRAWLLDREGIEIDKDGVFHVLSDGGLDMEIKFQWF